MFDQSRYSHSMHCAGSLNPSGRTKAGTALTMPFLCRDVGRMSDRRQSLSHFIYFCQLKFLFHWQAQDISSGVFDQNKDRSMFSYISSCCIVHIISSLLTIICRDIYSSKRYLIARNHIQQVCTDSLINCARDSY